MARLRYLTEEHATRIVTRLTQRLFPGTPTLVLQPGQGVALLHSALGQPRWSYHRTLQIKAAVLHYGLNKNHPFVDGNKRFAVAATDVFLLVNNAELVATEDEVTAFALGVAMSEIDQAGCRAFFKSRVHRHGWDMEQRMRWLIRHNLEELETISTIFRSWEASGLGRSERIFDALQSLDERANH